MTDNQFHFCELGMEDTIVFILKLLKIINFNCFGLGFRIDNDLHSLISELVISKTDLFVFKEIFFTSSENSLSLIET